MKRLFRKYYKEYHEYLLPVLGGIGIILLSLYVLIPQVQSIINTIQITSEKGAQLKKFVAKRELLNSVTSGSTQVLLKDAEAALPLEKDAASILIALENLSQQSLFTLDSVSFTPGLVSTESGTITQTNNPAVKAPPKQTQTGKSAHGAQILTVSIKGKGETTQFVAFLDLIYKIRRIFDILDMRIAYTVDEPDFLSTEMTLQTYYLPPISEISAIDAELPRISATEQKILADIAKFPILTRTVASTSSFEPENLLPVGKTDLFSP